MKNYIKHIALFLLTISLSSCSKDDDAQPQENNKLLERMNFGGTLLNFYYNEDNSLKSVEFYDDLFEFSYENDQISSIIVSNEDEEDEYLFQYDANGKIDSYTANGQQVDIEYDSASRAYYYERPDGFDISLSLYDNDEIKEIEVKNVEDEVVFHTEVFYDTSKKGSMYNSNAKFLQSYIANLGVAIYFNKYPVQLITNSNEALSFANTYDEDGFVVRADAGTAIIDYFYTE